MDGIRRRVGEFNRDHCAHKKGWAMMPVRFGIAFTKSHLNQGWALVHFYADGSVGVTTGGIEMGQGISRTSPGWWRAASASTSAGWV